MVLVLTLPILGEGMREDGYDFLMMCFLNFACLYLFQAFHIPFLITVHIYEQAQGSLSRALHPVHFFKRM